MAMLRSLPINDLARILGVVRMPIGITPIPKKEFYEGKTMAKRLSTVLITVITAVFGLAMLSIGTVSAQDFSNHRMVLGMAEIITDPASGEAGRVVWLRKDLGNGHLDHDFVYGDPRRAALNGGYDGVTYGVKTGFQSADVSLT